MYLYVTDLERALTPCGVGVFFINYAVYKKSWKM